MTGRMRWILAIGLAIALSGCHDRHGTAKMVDGVMHFRVGWAFSGDCGGEKPDWLNDEQYETMCSAGPPLLNECATRSAAIGIDVREGGTIKDFSVKCDTDDFH